MDAQILILILLALALVVGVVGLVLARRRPPTGSGRAEPSAPDTTPPTPPPRTGDDRDAGRSDSAATQPPAAVDVVERPGFRDRLGRARAQLGGLVSGVFGRGASAETWEELEEILIRADVGVRDADRLVSAVREAAGSSASGAELTAHLKQTLRQEFGNKDRSLAFAPGLTNVWLFVGVNGVGKTTTIGKVAAQQNADGRSVILAAGDTFRAAAAEQLSTWAQRAGVQVVVGTEGGDPGAVVFDAVQRAASRGADLVLADTAGRLQNKANLMEELRKVRRVADKDPGHVSETLLVLDATTGQNGLSQAAVFAEAADVTGVVLTKLDGSAKGGIAFSIESQLGIPIKLVGLGEGVGDLVAFDPDEFVDALFDE